MLAEGVAAMIAEEHVQQAVLQYPALQEVLQPLDTPMRASIMQAIILTIRQAQHEERRVCAKIALSEAEDSVNGACMAVVERIAAAIIARDRDE